MSKPHGKNWKLLGGVGVDSGQLLVCDPSYIDSEWIPNQQPAGHPTYVLTDIGKKEFPTQKDWSWRYDFNNSNSLMYDSEQPTLGGMTINDAIDKKLVIALPQGTTNEFSYRGCCDTSIHGGGSLMFKKGHDGTGVCFSSGYGDGYYEVWGKENTDGRIVEVRIIMD